MSTETTPAPGAPAAPASETTPPAAAVTASTPAAEPTTPAAETKPTAKGDWEPKLPEGVELDGEQLKGYRALAKEIGLKPEHAQKLLDFHLGNLSAQTKAQEEERAGWRKALEADKEIGGANLEKNQALAAKAMQKFATPEFKEFLEKSGMGDHPEMARMFIKLGQALGEDSVAGAATSGAGPNTEEATLRAMYPKSFESMQRAAGKGS